MITTRTTTAALIILAAGGTWGLVQNEVEAADSKTVAAAFCEPYDAQSTVWHSRGGGGAINAFLAPIDVHCPIERDIVAGTLDDVWITVNNKSASNPVTCTVYSRSPLGTFEDSEQRSRTSAGTGEIAFTLSSFSEVDHGYYYAYCELEFDDWLSALRWRES